MHSDPANNDSAQSLLAASAWAALKEQCPKNYELLKANFQHQRPELPKSRALTEHIRQISGRPNPTSFNYMLWLMEALCTNASHRHRIDHATRR